VTGVTAATVSTSSESETIAVGRDFGALLRAGAVVLLSGDLGAGKTAFVRGIAEGLGIDGAQVTSPTFTLVHEYRGGRLPLYHADLYRVASVEVDELGLDELGEDGGAGVTAIEWPDRLPRRWPRAIPVHIEHGRGDTRTISINPPEEEP
jgi:tRNA threonylcarbamoyladenosine biosynthesis protein TsaE